MDALGSFIATQLPPSERGVPSTPVAILLSPTHGWSEKPSWGGGGQAANLWGYANIPSWAKKGSGAVDGLLSAAYPGAGGVFGMNAFPFGSFEDNLNPPASPWARSSMTSQYAPHPDDVWHATAALPFGKFHDRDELNSWFHENNNATGDADRDPAAWRPLSDSRWGDVFDVLVTDPWLRWGQALSGGGYKVVLWCDGDGLLTDEAAAALSAFASAGGTVVVSAGAVGPQHELLTGVKLTGRLRAARAWEWSSGVARSRGDEGVTLESLLLAEAEAIDHGDDGATVIVARSIPEGLPIVVKNRVGEGHIYTCLVPWFESNGLSAVALELFDRVIGAVQPVTVVEGLNALLHTSSLKSNQTTSSRHVALANNAGEAWTGTIEVDHGALFSCSTLRCDDIIRGTSMECTCSSTTLQHKESDIRHASISFSRGGTCDQQQQVRLSLSIAPYDIAVVRVSCLA